tara:strand:+ start:732 stop:1298 length:567 start_codon:yes stop_codon:yes gene_type:complete
MRKLTVVTKFKNIAKNIVSTYRIAHRDEKTGKNTWIGELDFKAESNKTDTTNNMLLNNKKPWTVLEFDLDTIERVDGTKDSVVSFYEVIQALAKQCKSRIAQGVIKLVVTPENKKDVIKAIKDGFITESNAITDVVLKKDEVNTAPDLTPDFEDDEINGMADIEAKLKESASKQKAKITKELDVQLKE